MTTEATDDPADRRGTEDRRREQDPDERPNRDPSPRAVLRGLFMLVDMDLAVVVLVDHRGVIRADKLVRMKLEQDVVIGPRIIGAGVRRCIDKNRSITHLNSHRRGWPECSLVAGPRRRSAGNTSPAAITSNVLGGSRGNISRNG
jgi:hypothetical protein